MDHRRERGRTAGREVPEPLLEGLQTGWVHADCQEGDAGSHAGAAMLERVEMLMDDREQQIRDRAYAIWQREGRPEGRERDHWNEAMRELEDERKSGGGHGSRAGAETGEAATAGTDEAKPTGRKKASSSGKTAAGSAKTGEATEKAGGASRKTSGKAGPTAGAKKSPGRAAKKSE